MIGAKIGMKVVIADADLQLDGITKNQAFGLDEHDKPAREILSKALRLANPDGKLVYIVRNDTILITTKAAADRGRDATPPTSLAKNAAAGNLLLSLESRGPPRR